MATIQIRRGAVAGLPTGGAGEPLFTTDQFRLYVGSSGGNRLLGLLDNINAAVAPGVNDDAGEGYSVGSHWTDTTHSKTYICVNNTLGAAVWQQVSGPSGVTAGSYTNANVTVNSNGTISAVSNGSTAPSGSASGDLSGSYPNPTVAKLNGTLLSGLATGILKNTTGTGVPSIASASDIPTVAAGGSGPLSATDATTTNSRTPNGSAGGSLAGSYPNPTIAASGVTAGSYTNANITVGSDGRVTAAANGTAPVGRSPNIIQNGGFDTWQRGTSGITAGSNGAVVADRWYHLFQTASVQWSQDAGNLGARYAAKLNQTAVGTELFGLAHIVEASDSIPYRGQAVTFQFQAKVDTNRNLRAAILEWTGTADSVTHNVVNNWSSTTYTNSNFFANTNLTITAVSGSLGAVSTGYTQFSVTGTVGSSCNNLILFIWTESTVPTNGTVTVTACDCHYGSGVTQTWLPKSVQENLADCQRQLYAISGYSLGLTDTANLCYNGTVVFPTTMRAAPSVLSGASFSIGGTVASQFATTTSIVLFNSANNWAAATQLTATATFSAEL